MIEPPDPTSEIFLRRIPFKLEYLNYTKLYRDGDPDPFGFYLYPSNH